MAAIKIAELFPPLADVVRLPVDSVVVYKIPKDSSESYGALKSYAQRIGGKIELRTFYAPDIENDCIHRFLVVTVIRQGRERKARGRPRKND